MWILMAVLSFLLAVLTVFGNLLLLLAICLKPKHRSRKPSEYLTTGLAASGLATGIISDVVIGTKDVFLARNIPFPRLPEDIVFSVTNFTLFCNISLLVVMSIDRLIAICDPLKYKQRATTRRVTACLVTIAILGIGVGYFLPWGMRRVKASLVMCHMYVTVPGFFLTFIYLWIFRTVKKQRKNINNYRDSCVSNKQVHHKETKLLTTIVLLLVAFYISMVPFFVSNHLMIFCRCRRSTASLLFSAVSRKLLYLNAATSPYLYAWKLPKYREAMVRVLVKGREALTGKEGALRASDSLTTRNTAASTSMNENVTLKSIKINSNF